MTPGATGGHMEELLRAVLDAVVALDLRAVELVVAARRPLATKAMTSVTGLGSATAAFVVVALFRQAGWREEFLTAGVALVVTGAVVGALMATVQRPFPPEPVCVTEGAGVATSFPSGHAAAATVYAATARRSEHLPFAVVAVLAAGIAVSRIYLGTHYLSDTVVGVAIGVGAFLAAERLLASDAVRERLPA